jgi:hypothetical protein
MAVTSPLGPRQTVAALPALTAVTGFVLGAFTGARSRTGSPTPAGHLARRGVHR